MTDYATFETIAELESPDPTLRRVALRFIASIDDAGYLQENIKLTCSYKIDTNNKLALHIPLQLSGWFEALKYVPPVETECPICRDGIIAEMLKQSSGVNDVNTVLTYDESGGRVYDGDKPL